MFETATFVSPVIAIILFTIVLVKIASLKKELSNQTRLQATILRKLELSTGENSSKNNAEEDVFQLFIYDSKDRKYLFRNINTKAYETAPGEAPYAIAMTSTKKEIITEIIKQNGIMNTLESIRIKLDLGRDNYIDLAEYSQ